jgi:hypothetical protein
MPTTDRQDNARQTGDRLDRVIDEAIESALRAGPVDLRSQVLARLDEPVGGRPSRLPGFPPALLPVAGALIMMAGVTILWQHADQQLSQATSRRGSTRAAYATAPAPADRPVAQVASAEPVGAPDRAGAAHPRDRREAKTEKAPAWLETDSDQTAVAPAAPLAAAAPDEPDLPGAPAGDLGDPIAPMPKLRPIAIQPLATPPIPDAPPISTLSMPVSTLTDEVSRDRQDPGKPGGK